MSGSNDPEILNIEQAAALLGVSVKTFNKVLHSQDLPARKIGREWKFSRQHLINWVGSGRSSEFYRESGGDAHAVVTPHGSAAQSLPTQSVPANGTDVDSHQPTEERRTSGWSIQPD